MGGELTEETIPGLREQVQSAVEKILEYKGKEKDWEDKKSRIEARLAGLIKRLEEFSGGG